MASKKRDSARIKVGGKKGKFVTAQSWRSERDEEHDLDPSLISAYIEKRALQATPVLEDEASHFAANTPPLHHKTRQGSLLRDLSSLGWEKQASQESAMSEINHPVVAWRALPMDGDVKEGSNEEEAEQ